MLYKNVVLLIWAGILKHAPDVGRYVLPITVAETGIAQSAELSTRKNGY
jgi:hypothetical protein